MYFRVPVESLEIHKLINQNLLFSFPTRRLDTLSNRHFYEDNIVAPDFPYLGYWHILVGLIDYKCTLCESCNLFLKLCKVQTLA